MDSRQYAELFLTESREHIAAVNRALLELERDATSAAASSAVGAIFRAVHTIKGMAGTMGYTVVAELAHELETALDGVRRHELAIDAELIDLLFRAADVLERCAEAAVAGEEADPGAAELVTRLRVLTTRTPAAQATAGSAAGANLDAPGRLVRIRLRPNTPLRGVRAYLIVQALGAIGQVTAMDPVLDALQAERFDDTFALRLVSASDTAEIEQVVRGAGDVADVQVVAERTPPARDAAAATPAESSRAGSTAPANAAATESRAATGRRNVRIDVKRLDNLMNLIGELVVARGRLTQLASELGSPALEETVASSSRLITELRDEITASRMVPASQVFDRFPRVVRDAARAVGKQVDFVIEGSDIELDRSMLDEIADALVHLLRNAVDHGIERPDARARAGKPAAGRIVLSAARDRSAVVIKVSDDGKGIDRERVLARAKADGLVDAAKPDLTEDELLRLLARPGFSTAESVTDLSGRGVGVDAVYTRVRALGGAMDIRSVPGQGTTMVLRLPLTLAIVRALLARVADETYAIPLAHVAETVELTPDTVRTIKGREVLLAREDVLPLLRLRSLVGLPAFAGPADASDAVLEQVVVIDVGDRRAALVIDELTGQDEIVVKQYDAVRDGLPFFGGATLLGDGRPSLIVDVSSLL